MSPTRRFLRASFLALTIAVAAPVLAAPSQAAPLVAGKDGDEPAAEVPLRVATFNTAATISTAKAVADITKLANKRQKPDVISLQEMGSPDRRRLVREKLVDCDTCVYDAYIPLPATQASTPVLYRSDRFVLESATTVQVTKPTFVGKRGAGPSTIRAKYVNWVQLFDVASGRRINVLNNHAVPSVQGKDGGPNRSMAKRLAIYQQHMDGLRAVIEGIDQGLTFVTGDLNVNFRRDRVLKPHVFPYYNMGLEKLQASYARLGMPATGTHVLGNGNSTRLIDYVYFATRGMLRPVRQQIVTHVNSDHRPLVVDFAIKPRQTAPDPLTPAQG